MSTVRAYIVSKCQPILLISPPAVLILIWNFLIYTHYFLFSRFTSGFATEVLSFDTPIWYVTWLVILICFSYSSFPLFGLLADVWIGRYKAILIGIVLCFIGWIITGIGLIAEIYFASETVLWSFYSVAYIIHVSGYSTFYANIIQYNIDQLVGASADELSSVIYWHILSQPLVDLFYYLLQCLFYSSKYFFIITFIASGVSVSLVLVSHSFFKHKLENISLIKNPIKLIVRVLCYARKHKYTQNRSALTYWEEEAPSRLDLGKDKYGGPFTEEEVEDVKTVFRMLPLFIGFVALNCCDDSYSPVFDSYTLSTCLAVTGSLYSLCSVILMLVYLFFIRVCFYKYIPSMLTRMSVGIFLAFIVTVSEVIIFVIKRSHPERSHPDINNFSKLLFIPQTIQGLTFILFYPVSLEFAVAQSPVHMRGVMVGLWYATAWGLSYLNSIVAKFLFDCENPYMCTSFYYYITKSVLVLIILIVFVILAKRYKYRVRENEVNIVQIVDDHYQRYMEQEEQYNRNRNDDIQYSIQ
uniref:Major facilitator superfamily (MFS) profile domain-containing protein n=1 Tax=Amphimedon queenslandica TaxID=400682 RepID=A0A1X7UPX4_AMPQE